MSTLIFKKVKLEQIAKALTEGVDLQDVQPVQLAIGRRVEFEYGDSTFGMMVQPYSEGTREWLPSIVSPEQDLKGYYNFGFDFEGLTQREKKQSYKELAKPLAIIVQSFMAWLKQKRPKMVTFYADGATAEERKKKLNLYVALFNRESNALRGLGYTWDYANTKMADQAVVVWQVEK
jgi:hypothetical protein